jgi:hypothetical protein
MTRSYISSSPCRLYGGSGTGFFCLPVNSTVPDYIFDIPLWNPTLRTALLSGPQDSTENSML